VSTRARRTLGHLAILAAGMIIVLASTQSCSINGSKTDLCVSGRRCPVGWKCTAEGDGCTQNGCGDGHTDYAAGEICDDGNIVNDETCSADCKALPGCGNGLLEEGEVCDEGDTVSGDGCSADCASLEECGNAIIDVGEVCDDGNLVSNDGCSDDCTKIETCGNGQRDPGEVCDNGGALAGDGCSPDCLSNESCGNGYLDEAIGETCDVGDEDTAECNAKECTMARCGDGYFNRESTDPPEECDRGGNAIDCDADCTEPSCGDGFVNDKYEIDPDGDGGAAPYVEKCDDGDNGEPADSMNCDRDCTPKLCGDGYPNAVAGELCDDGDGDNGDDCPDGPDGTCEDARCGDGFLLAGVEVCDDGNANTGDSCPDGPEGSCQFARCGDGFVYPGGEKPEACDDGNASNTDACLSTCVMATCGDGFVREGEDAEECDHKAMHPGCQNGEICTKQCTCVGIE
jgi:cysteine-rich repeat protein